MRVRTVLLLGVLAAVGIFAALNWGMFTAPASLHLGFARVDAPLGIIMLPVTTLVTGLYVGLLGWPEMSALLEARRYALESHTQSQLAESAEASRLGELRPVLETGLGELRVGAGRRRPGHRRTPGADGGRATRRDRAGRQHPGGLHRRTGRPPGSPEV